MNSWRLVLRVGRCRLVNTWDAAQENVFNKSVEKFVEKPTPDYGKVKSVNEF